MTIHRKPRSGKVRTCMAIKKELKHLRIVLLLLPVVATSGCWNSSKYPLAPVSGVVTLDGEPLGNAFVNFQPKGGPSSKGITNAEGRYSLITIDGAEGAVVGPHTVSIYSVHSQEAAAESDLDLPTTPKERVPDRYNYNTTLTFEVPADGTTTADWDLKTSS